MRPELTEAERLVSDGDLVGAIDLLATANRQVHSPEVEQRLIDLRHGAAEHLRGGQGRIPWPPTYDDPFPNLSGQLPEVDRSGLSTEVVGGAVAHHGALYVRNLFLADQVDRCIATVDRAHQARAEANGGPSTWSSAYRPFSTGVGRDARVKRKMVADMGGIWMADSPTGAATCLQALHDVGAVAIMAEHFGERPFFSLQKSTLRRSAPEPQVATWHQDGAFLDAGVRTMNVWVALSPCGGDLPTPGLEVMPRRMPEVLPSDGELFPHSVSFETVATIAEDTPTTVPRFEPGDALMFDERFLHRTHLPDGMNETRYALECWFFAPSHGSSGYISLLA